MKNKFAITLTALALVFVVGIGTTNAFGGEYKGDPDKREAVRGAFETGDYSSFLSATEGMRMAEKIDEASFDVLVQARELKRQGDYEGARALVKESGLEVHKKFSGEKIRHKFHNSQKRMAYREAIENNDFAAWQELISDKPMLGQIDTQEEFDLFVQAHDLRKAGEEDAAKEIFEQLGLRKAHDRK